jgi:hypothetical protein
MRKAEWGNAFRAEAQVRLSRPDRRRVLASFRALRTEFKSASKANLGYL